MNKHIDEEEMSTARNTYFKSAPIDEIMPSDIIQQILTFQQLDLQNIKLVNKQWNRLSKQNEKHCYLRLQETFKENSPIEYDPDWNATWILHPKQGPLTEIEQE